MTIRYFYTAKPWADAAAEWAYMVEVADRFERDRRAVRSTTINTSLVLAVQRRLETLEAQLDFYRQERVS